MLINKNRLTNTSYINYEVATDCFLDIVYETNEDGWSDSEIIFQVEYSEDTENELQVIGKALADYYGIAFFCD